MSLVNQGGELPQTVYVKHPSAGVKTIPVSELAQHLAVGYRQLIEPSWFYHQIQSAEIFDKSEAEELYKKGWVSSPADLTPKDVIPSNASPESIDWEDPNVINIDEKACELLAGEGLNQASLMRSLKLDPKKTKQRNEIKPYFKAIIAKYLPRISKQQNDYFWTKENQEDKATLTNDPVTEDAITVEGE